MCFQKFHLFLYLSTSELLVFLLLPQFVDFHLNYFGFSFSLSMFFIIYFIFIIYQFLINSDVFKKFLPLFSIRHISFLHSFGIHLLGIFIFFCSLGAYLLSVRVASFLYGFIWTSGRLDVILITYRISQLLGFILTLWDFGAEKKTRSHSPPTALWRNQ